MLQVRRVLCATRAERLMTNKLSMKASLPARGARPRCDTKTLLPGRNLLPLFWKAAVFVSLLLSVQLFRAAETKSPGQLLPQKPALIFVEAAVVSRSAPPLGLLQRFPEGSRLVRLSPAPRAPNSSQAENLTTDFFAVSDPQVSYDAAKVLFAGKKDRASSWQIWEMEASSLEKHQVTNCPSDCVRPVYLPRNDIAYTMVTSRDSEVYVSKTDGTIARAITFGPGNFVVETALADGRILLTAAAPLSPDSTAQATRELYTVRSDGTGLSSFRCDHRPGVVRTDAIELSDGTVVFVKTDAQSLAGGALAAIPRGALHNSAISSPVGPASAVYVSPQPWDSGQFIVSKLVAGTNHFDLYAYDAAKGQGQRVFGDPSLSSLNATTVESRTPPRWYWSTIKPDLGIGYFVCLNSRVTSDAPGGVFSQAAKVRVLTLDTSSGHESTLGDARVESDGSFYLAVPPNQPVRFELLDGAGKTVHAQRSWIWARPGEDRGCVGCHEDKAQTPENLWPQALRSFDTPTRLGLPTPAAAQQ